MRVGKCLSLLLVTTAAAEHLRSIFTDDEVKHCKGQFDGPSFVYDSDGILYVFVQCAKRVSSLAEPWDELRAKSQAKVGDIMGEAICVMKSSSTHGVNWGNFTTLSPEGKKGYGECKGLFDVHRRQLVVQYSHTPSGDSAQTAGKSFYQITSTNHGKTWSNPQNLTADISGCDAGDAKPRMMAGNRLQTSSGRLLWGGESSGAPCFWYSDDGGKTYQVTKRQKSLNSPNEFSLVQTATAGQIYMNSRKGSGCTETNHRRQYISNDDGVTWTGPTCSSLLDAVNQHGHGCQASMTNVGGRLFFLNPGGKTGEDARSDMQVHCSKDNGKSWGSTYHVSSTHDGGYSDLIYMGDKDKNPLLLGFQNSDHSNILTVAISLGWC